MELKWEDCYLGQLSVGEEGLPFCQDVRWSVVLLQHFGEDSLLKYIYTLLHMRQVLHSIGRKSTLYPGWMSFER